MTETPGLRYYLAVLYRRLSHYAEKRTVGYTDRGSLEAAAGEILTARAARGFRAGSHFPGVWPRDLCFAARGLSALGFDDQLRTVAAFVLDRIDGTFYTDFRSGKGVATPAEGVDTFPAIVLLLHQARGLTAHAAAIERLAGLHREKFFDEETGIVSGWGSAWWDSAAGPREAYNTAMLLAAIERLEVRGVETPYAGRAEAVRSGLENELWNGEFFEEVRRSPVVACDANVVPLYFELVDDETAGRLVTALERLRTENGLKMRERPFARREVRPAFLLHRDYHYHVWPWNSFMYANGLRRYGFDDRAEREVERIERLLRPYGNFLEVLSLDGTPYVKRGYASAEDFTVAAALWVEYGRRRVDSRSPF